MELNFFLQDVIEVESRTYHVTGMVSYKNVQDGSQWNEYRLMEEGTYREFWLSVDPVYQEYAMYQMTGYQERFSGDGLAREGYREADSGVQVVTGYQGNNLDVDNGEKARYWEYEDKSTEKIIAIEEWSDGREYSTGYYVDKEDIKLLKRGNGGNASNVSYSSLPSGIKSGIKWVSIIQVIAFLAVLFGIFGGLFGSLGGNSIKKHLKNTTEIYTYRTSITASADSKEKADVYVSTYSIDATVKDIIDAIEGDVENVQQNTDDEDDSVAILTDDEYCLVYTSSDHEVLVQVSKRSFVYSSDNEPYHSHSGTRRFYRRHYYTWGYGSDKSRYSKKNDSYSGYNDTSLPYSGYDSYSSYASSVRQSSLARRRSSGGGTSSGK